MGDRMSNKLQVGPRRLLLALALALFCQLTAAAVARAGQTQTFTPEAGASQAYSVPAEVTELKVTAVGGAGQAGSCYTPGPGGSGAKVTAVIEVREREKLYVQFGGGGRGGSSSFCPEGGGEGGGASDLRALPYQLGTRLVVAGGGGGGGGGGDFTTAGAGGSAEGVLGEDGTAGPGIQGDGGSESGGGSGAEHGGSFGEGGEGQAGGAGGGGGGGGYYGGGGGGASELGGGGGGAGSSYVTASALSREFSSGAGDPQEVSIEAIKVPVSAPADARIFYPEGGQQEYAVPSGAKHLEVLAVGGAGEDGESVACGPVPITSQAGGGGGGARVNAFLNVSEGERLYVDFGPGGTGGTSGECSGRGGAGGGDAAVQSEPMSEPLALFSRLVVAGGGGGGGGGDIFPFIEDSSGGGGGSAGGLVGGGGGNGSSSCCGGGPGGGGGNTETGRGGSAGAEGSGASAGGFGFAGNGGNPSGHPYTTGGGGGGDGYYGGGGGECGGAGVEDPEECDKALLHDAYAAGGGGAGSSYVTPQADYAGYETAYGQREHVLIRPVAALPSITVQLAPGGDYPAGAKGTATVVCEEEAAYAAGIESCAGQKSSPATVSLNTNFAGEHSFVAKAVSDDGAVSEEEVTYTVYNPLSAGVSRCSGTTGGSGREVLVTEGAVCTLIAGTHVSGQVRVERGGSLIDSGASIGSNILAREASTLQIGGARASAIGGSVEIERLAGTVAGAKSSICNATIAGGLKIAEAASRAGLIALGAETCASGVSIGGSLTLSRDAAAVEALDTTAAAIAVQSDRAPVTLLAGKTSGALTISSDAAPVSVRAETVGGNLLAVGNTARLVLEDDTAGANLLVEHNSGGVEMLDDSAQRYAQCKDNTPPATGSGTSAHEHNFGCPA